MGRLACARTRTDLARIVGEAEDISVADHAVAFRIDGHASLIVVVDEAHLRRQFDNLLV